MMNWSCLFSFLEASGVIFHFYLSRVVRKPAFGMCENKDADHDREADQRLCFRYTDSIIPLLS